MNEKLEEEKIVRPEFSGPRLHIHLQPEDHNISLPLAKTVRQLLAALDLAEETALVAREGKLLTPDIRLFPEESILVQKVTSRG